MPVMLGVLASEAEGRAALWRSAHRYWRRPWRHRLRSARRQVRGAASLPVGPVDLLLDSVGPGGASRAAAGAGWSGAPVGALSLLEYRRSSCLEISLWVAQRGSAEAAPAPSSPASASALARKILSIALIGISQVMVGMTYSLREWRGAVSQLLGVPLCVDLEIGGRCLLCLWRSSQLTVTSSAVKSAMQP